MIKGFDVNIKLSGVHTTFSVDIRPNGDYRLHVISEDESLAVDMSQGQFYALGAAHNDADGQVVGFVGQEFGDE